MNGPVGWAGLAVSLLMAGVAAGTSWWQRLGLERQILAAAARALAQLLLVGVALTQPGRRGTAHPVHLHRRRDRRARHVLASQLGKRAPAAAQPAHAGRG